MERRFIARIRLAVAPVTAVVVSLLIGAAVSAQSNKQPAPTSLQPNQGLRSVAERAERGWNAAHASFTKELTVAQDPCNPALKQSVASVQAALGERTRAWTEFYTQQGYAADEYKKAAAASELQEEATARTAETDIERLSELIAELKQRKEAMIAGGTNGLDEEAAAKALQDLDDLIKLREQTITALGESAAIARRSVVAAQEVQKAHGSAAITASAFGDLIRAQHKLYDALYRGRQMRLALDCGPIRIIPPPAPPPLN